LRASPFSGKETPTTGLVVGRHRNDHHAMEPPVIQAYALRNGRIERAEIGKGTPLPDDLVWIDVVQPTPEERGKVEAAYGPHLADAGRGAGNRTFGSAVH
jgi:Mg2+ and Co2+ transporter CorA